MHPPLIDIGVNLTHAAFRTDRAEVLARAQANGVQHIVVTGTTLAHSQQALRLAGAYPSLLTCTAGVHPHHARDWNGDSRSALRELAQHQAVVAIGECGLDFNRDFSPRPAQEACFAAQLELACELGLPVFLHERDAHARFIEILAEYRPRLRHGVVHCFTGEAAALKAYLDLDLHIGITGWICDERRGRHLCELLRHIPLERLMLETDAPFLTPRNMRPAPRNGRNEPAFLPHVAVAVAQALGQPVAHVAAATTATAQAFFAR